MSAEAIAWAAGLFEGEGCISHSEGNGKRAVRLMLRMNDEDVVRRFRDIMECGNVRPPTIRDLENDRRCFTWAVQARADVERVLLLLEPWLGNRRHAKMREELALADPLSRDGESCLRGHKFTPENTYIGASGRQCRTCMRAARRRYYLAGKKGSVACAG